MSTRLLFERLADQCSQRCAALGGHQAQALEELFGGDNRRALHHETYTYTAIMLSSLA